MMITETESQFVEASSDPKYLYLYLYLYFHLDKQKDYDDGQER